MNADQSRAISKKSKMETGEPPAKLLKAGGSRHSGQAKHDPESSPARSGIQTDLDSGLRRNDGKGNICKNLQGFG
jgi:hypothetical protein